MIISKLQIIIAKGVYYFMRSGKLKNWSINQKLKLEICESEQRCKFYNPNTNHQIPTRTCKKILHEKKEKYNWLIHDPIASMHLNHLE